MKHLQTWKIVSLVAAIVGMIALKLSCTDITAQPAIRPVQSLSAKSISGTLNAQRIPIPPVWPDITDFSQPITLPGLDGTAKPLTIDPRLQKHLEVFLQDRADPISSVIVVEVATGRVLAMAQGRHPEKWEAKEHSALYSNFPAASLFKTVVAAAAIEVAGVDPLDSQVLWGGCGNVNRSGVWLRDDEFGRANRLSLRSGYGRSCNGLFAKLGVNVLGLNTIATYANRLGWNEVTDADFVIPISPISIPDPKTSSIHTVGRFAAGFGDVGASVAQQAWQMLALANGGVSRPLILLQENLPKASASVGRRVVEQQTAEILKSIMDASTNGGTASGAFRKPKYRKLKELAGGKTGTLTGKKPFGVTSWFAGMMPMNNPQVVVVAVVVLDKLWHIKGPDLAAEALWAYDDLANETSSKIASKFGPGPQINH